MSNVNISHQGSRKTTKIDCDKYPTLCNPLMGTGGGTGGLEMPSSVVQYAEYLQEQGQTWQPSNYNIIAAMCNDEGMPQFAESYAQAAIELAPEADHLIRAEAWQRRADAFHRQNLPELENQAIEQAINSLAMARS